MIIADLCCKAGGAAEGYRRAGFEVVGVDIEPQPNYPFEFHRADAIHFLLEHWQEFDGVHGSPPCQLWSNAHKIQNNDHPDLVRPLQAALDLIGLPYIIENVVGAPLRDPIMLCGAMFPGLGTYRHRLFESNIPLTIPDHPEHTVKLTKMGRTPRDGEFMHVVGNFSGVKQAREAMGITWMTRDELRESIPPAYTEFLGHQLREYIERTESLAA